MSKILKNITIGNISITDTGITINASSQYVIPPQDYLLWAASDNIITYIGSGDIVVNDGSNDLGISDGVDLIKGLFPNPIGILGGTDDTQIGNTGDSLHSKVTASVLPDGAATEAKQDVGNTSLSAIDTQMTDGSQVSKIRGATDGTEIGNIADSIKANITNTTPIPVDGDLKTTAFGELATLAIDPYIALIPTQGIKPREVEVFLSGSGSVADVVDNNPGKEFRVSSGTSVGGYGVIRSKKTLLYRPGIGSLGRFTARFSAPVANAIQRVGFFNIGNELTVGYNGTQFGILRKTGGRPEIRKLTINTSSNQSTNITITLDGTPFVVPVTNASASINASEIAAFSFNGWNVYSISNTIIFQSKQTANQNGAYSAVPAGGNFSGSFSQITQGEAGIENWIYQGAWSETNLNSGSDPFILDTTKGNVFQIQYQYLGYGQILFSVEDPSTGDFIPFHRITYTNNNVTPSLDIPNMKMGIIAANTTNTSSVSVYSACLAGFNENDSPFPLSINAADNDIKGISTTLVSVLSLRKNTINGLEILDVNDVQIEDLTVAADATKPVFFQILLNPTFNSSIIWQQSQGISPIVVSNTESTLTGGILIYSIAISKSSNLRINLKDLDVILSNDDVICIAARTTAGSADVAAAMVWGSK